MAEQLAPQTRHLFFTLIVPQHKVNAYLLYIEGSWKEQGTLLDFPACF